MFFVLVLLAFPVVFGTWPPGPAWPPRLLVTRFCAFFGWIFGFQAFTRLSAEPCLANLTDSKLMLILLRRELGASGGRLPAGGVRIEKLGLRAG